MIKFTGKQKNGRNLIGIGLSYENMVRLKNDNPIMFDAAEIGFEGTDIMILAGDTEDSIKRKVSMQ